MRKFLKSKKGIALLAVVAVAAVAAVGAYAYFTTTGSGSGTATVGTSSAVTLHGTAPSGLYPGTSSVVNFTVDNPSSGHQFVTKIHLVSITAYPTDGDRTAGTNAIAGCGSISDGASPNPATPVADFYMADVNASQDFAAGNGQAVTATGTLTMNNRATSQDACKDAFLKLTLSSV